jgi:hypothetical protein
MMQKKAAAFVTTLLIMSPEWAVGDVSERRGQELRVIAQATPYCDSAGAVRHRGRPPASQGGTVYFPPDSRFTSR